MTFCAKKARDESVFMSGYTDDIIGWHGVLEPGVSFINKLVTVSNLAGVIREFFGQLEVD